AGSLAPEGGGDIKAQRFVEGFIRPFGLDSAATPRFADAIENLGASPRPQPEGNGAVESLLRLPLYPAVGALQALLVSQPYRKQVRFHVTKFVQDGRPKVLIALKQFA